LPVGAVLFVSYQQCILLFFNGVYKKWRTLDWDGMGLGWEGKVEEADWKLVGRGKREDRETKIEKLGIRRENEKMGKERGEHTALNHQPFYIPAQRDGV
jgi:hypothetical protein